MRYKSHVSSIALALLCLCNAVAYSADKSYAEIKKDLIGKDVYIKDGDGTRSGISRTLSDWEYADGTKGIGIFNHVPSSLAGARGTITSINIVPSSLEKDRPKTDLFGNKISDDVVIDPDIKLVVTLSNGTALFTRGYYATIQTRISIIQDVERRKNIIANNTDSIIGKVIFPVGYSRVYPLDISVEEMKNDLWHTKTLKVSNLTPLTISDVKFLDIENIVILKVAFLEDKSGVIFSSFIENPSSKSTILEQLAPDFLLNIPKGFTKLELAAIKKGEIIKGMSEKALYYSWGKPGQTNNWGNAGRQLIYWESVYVYLKDNKVVDWQELHR